jgi:hypothetical protein
VGGTRALAAGLSDDSGHAIVVWRYRALFCRVRRTLSAQFQYVLALLSFGDSCGDHFKQTMKLGVLIITQQPIL